MGAETTSIRVAFPLPWKQSCCAAQVWNTCSYNHVMCLQMKGGAFCGVVVRRGALTHITIISTLLIFLIGLIFALPSKFRNIYPAATQDSFVELKVSEFWLGQVLAWVLRLSLFFFFFFWRAWLKIRFFAAKTSLGRAVLHDAWVFWREKQRKQRSF